MDYVYILMQGVQTMPSIHSVGEFLSFVGIPTGILFAFLWYVRKVVENVSAEAKTLAKDYMEQAKAREDRMAAKIDYLEGFVTNTLQTLLGETKVALAESTEVIRDLHESVSNSNKAVEMLITRMVERPCLLPKDRQ